MLPVSLAVSEIIKDRVIESQLCLSIGASLSIHLSIWTRILQAFLIGAVQNNTERFNQSAKGLKQNGKMKVLHEWRLSKLSDVACDFGLLKRDVHNLATVCGISKIHSPVRTNGFNLQIATISTVESLLSSI